MNPKITVIIPVYKVEPYLRQCLDSVVNQTYRNLEIIIIDDGSPDNCGIICDEYAAKDERITVIHKENRGLCAARNDGMDRAAGEWIAFVDSDDWCELEYYEQLITAMGEENVDVFCAGGHFSDFKTRTLTRQGFTDNVALDKKEELDLLMAKLLVPHMGLTGKEANYTSNNGGPWDKLFNRAFLEKHHFRFDTTSKAWEDLWFNFQVFDKAERVGGCPYVGYHYRIINTSIVRGFNLSKPQVNYDFITKLHTYMDQREPNALIEQAMEAFCFITFVNSFRVCYFHPANTKSYKEIAGEIKDMKTWPYYHDAIYSNDNQYLSAKWVILKHLMRLPWVWPLKIVQMLNEKTRIK